MSVTDTTLPKSDAPNVPPLSPEQARLHRRSLQTLGTNERRNHPDRGWRAFYAWLEKALWANLQAKGITSLTQLEELAR